MITISLACSNCTRAVVEHKTDRGLPEIFHIGCRLCRTNTKVAKPSFGNSVSLYYMGLTVQIKHT